MDTNVEILVPKHAVKSVREALSPVRSTVFATEPSQRVVSRLLVSWLSNLDSSESHRDLEALFHGLRSFHAGWRSRHERVPVVFLSAGTGKTFSAAGLQALLHWSRLAPAEPYIAPDVDAVRRMILARQSGAERELIASASIEDGKLIVWTCEPVRYEVPVGEIAALANVPRERLVGLEVSSSGSRITWPEDDIDINLDTIRSVADPAIRRHHDRQTRMDVRRYAGAIRRFREERGLHQVDIAGLSDRQVRRIEEGGTVPQIGTLRKLAAAHQLSTSEYLAELAKRTRRNRVTQKASKPRRRRLRAKSVPSRRMTRHARS